MAIVNIEREHKPSGMIMGFRSLFVDSQDETIFHEILSQAPFIWEEELIEGNEIVCILNILNQRFVYDMKRPKKDKKIACCSN